MTNRYSKVGGRRVKRDRPQAGFGLIETLMMVAVMGAMLLIWNKIQVSRQIEETDSSVAEHARLIQAGINKYISDYKLPLVNSAAPAIPGFVSPLVPTLSQLQANPANNPYIPSGYNLANQLGMTYAVSLQRLPAGCTPGVNCTDITGMVTSISPLVDPTTNQADGRRVGSIANKIGLDAASSKSGAGTVLTGPAGTWPTANPRGNTPGILAMRVGFGSVEYNGLDHLLPRDGSRPMTGGLRMGGNPIINASTISATSNISTTAGTISSDSGSITTNSGSITTNSGSITTQSGNITTTTGKVMGRYFVPSVQTTGVACSDNSAIATAADGTLLVCRSGTWRVHTGLIAEKGGACFQPGTLATTSVSGEAVICRGTTYVALANQIGKFVEVSRQSVVDGTVVAQPACDAGGTPTFKFGMVQTAVDVTTAPPKQVSNLTASAGPGMAWTVSYKLRDDLGNQTSANVYNLQALMYLECKYP